MLVFAHWLQESKNWSTLSGSYLTFSVDLSGNSAYLIPDVLIGGIPIEEIYIYDGNQNTLLEQLSSVGLWSAMKNYYGSNVNDEHLRSIFEGRAPKQNPEYIPAVERTLPTNAAPQFPSRGGGFGSQYYELDGVNQVADPARKTEIIYRFPMSGLLSAMKTELLPLVVLNGLVIEITLMEAAKFLTLQTVERPTVGSAEKN